MSRTLVSAYLFVCAYLPLVSHGSFVETREKTNESLKCDESRWLAVQTKRARCVSSLAFINGKQ